MWPQELFERTKIEQELFNAHSAEVNHDGEDDWEVRLTHQTDNVEELRKRDSFADMSWMLFSLMEWMSVKIVFFDT